MIATLQDACEASLIWKTSLETPARSNITEAQRLAEYKEDLQDAIKAFHVVQGNVNQFFSS